MKGWPMLLEDQHIRVGQDGMAIQQADLNCSSTAAAICVVVKRSGGFVVPLRQPLAAPCHRGLKRCRRCPPTRLGSRAISTSMMWVWGRMASPSLPTPCPTAWPPRQRAIVVRACRAHADAGRCAVSWHSRQPPTQCCAGDDDTRAIVLCCRADCGPCGGAYRRSHASGLVRAAARRPQ